MRPTKRRLAARFVDQLGRYPVTELAYGLIETAREYGYTQRDVPALIESIEYELRRRFDAVEVQLTTAHEVNEDTLERLAGEIARQVGALHFTYTHSVDPDLVGGFEALAAGVSVRESIRAHLAQGIGAASA